MRKKLSLALAFALASSSSVVLKPHVWAAPEDVRTFAVTVEGDDGVPETGEAKATLIETVGEEATYVLSRTVGGASSAFTKGVAVANERTHVVRVTFLAPHKSGLVDALGGATEAKPDDTAKTSLTPSRPTEYEFQGTWQFETHTFHETWKELSRLTSDIKIITPTESGSFGPVVPFEAEVAKADHVVYYVDEFPVARFAQAGHHKTDLRVWKSGWHRFTVKAYGPKNGAKEGALVGEAETVFLCKGLLLSPPHGSKVTKERIRAEAIPLGLEGLATIELRLDHKKVITLDSAPWGADMSLGADGNHTIEAIARDAQGNVLARTHSTITLETGKPPLGELPLPPSHVTKLPELKGRPEIRSVPANPRNYQPGRGRRIDMIVIHKAEGTLDGTTSWFQNPRAKVSAHYVVDDNEIVQCVDDSYICWHAGNRAYNIRSLGIENSGFTEKDDMTDAHYQKLGQLVAWLCKQHAIPLDRQHVIGHDEVPNPDWPSHGTHWGGVDGHRDPGPHFDWAKLMQAARGS